MQASEVKDGSGEGQEYKEANSYIFIEISLEKPLVPRRPLEVLAQRYIVSILSMFTCIQLYIRMYVHMCSPLIPIHPCMYIYICTYVHMYIYVCTYVHMYIYVCTYILIFMCICTCVIL